MLNLFLLIWIGSSHFMAGSTALSSAQHSPLWLAELNSAERLLGINPDVIMEAAMTADEIKPNVLGRWKRVPEKDFAKFKNIEFAPRQDGEIEPGVHHIHVHVNHPSHHGAIKWQYILIAALASLIACVGLVTAAACWYKIVKFNAQQKTGRSGIGGGPGSNHVIGTGTQTSGDKRLAQSAQMYHFQQQKQQMIAAENGPDLRVDSSDEDSEMADAAEDFTVYECPGMAVAGEIEVQNPMFQPDRPSPTNSDCASVTNGDKTTSPPPTTTTSGAAEH